MGAVMHDDLAKFYATADIFICPSESEGFGLVYAEAASCETYVVGTDLPSIKNFIIDNETGFILKKLSATEISDKILYVLKNKHELRSIRKNARQKIVSLYDWEIVSSNYVNVIKTLGDSD